MLDGWKAGIEIAAQWHDNRAKELIAQSPTKITLAHWHINAAEELRKLKKD